jgi:hypothetical protein
MSPAGMARPATLLLLLRSTASSGYWRCVRELTWTTVSAHMSGGHGAPAMLQLRTTASCVRDRGECFSAHVPWRAWRAQPLLELRLVASCVRDRGEVFKGGQVGRDGRMTTGAGMVRPQLPGGLRLLTLLGAGCASAGVIACVAAPRAARRVRSASTA